MKLIKLWESGDIMKPDRPPIPDLTLRGFGNYRVGQRTEDGAVRDKIRQDRFALWVQDVVTSTSSRKNHASHDVSKIGWLTRTFRYS